MGVGSLENVSCNDLTDLEACTLFSCFDIEHYPRHDLRIWTISV